MRLLALLCLSYLLLSSPVLASSPDSLRPLWNQAQHLTTSRQTDAAIRLYQDTLLPLGKLEKDSQWVAFVYIKIAENYRKASAKTVRAQAIYALQHARQWLQQSRIDSVTGRYYFELGNHLRLIQAKPREAISAHLQALRIQQKVLPSDHPATAITCYGLGQDYQATTPPQMDSASVYFRQSLAIFQANPTTTRLELARRFWGVGNFFYEWRDKPDSVIRYYQQAATNLEEVGWEALSAAWQYNYLDVHRLITEVYLFQNRIGAAFQSLQQLGEFLAQHRDQDDWLKDLPVTYLFLQGNYFFLLHDLDRSADFYDRALRLCQEREDLIDAQQFKNLTSVLHQRKGYVHARSERFKVAIAENRLAIPYFEEKQDQDELVEMYLDMADYFLEVQQADSALIYYQKAQRLTQQAGLTQLSLVQGRLAYQRGKIYDVEAAQAQTISDQKAQAERARQAYFQSLRFYKNVYAAAHTENKSAFLAVAESYFLIRDYENAWRYTDSALLQLASSLVLSGEVGRPQNIIPSYTLLVQALTLQGQILTMRYQHQTAGIEDLKRALEIFRQADQSLDERVFSLSQEGSKRIFRNRLRTLYEEALSVCQLLAAATNQDFLPDQFYFIEKSRALNLLERLDDRQAKLTAGVDAAWLERETRLKEKLQFQTQRWKDQGFDPAIRANIAELNEQYLTFVQELEAAYPAYHQLKYDRQVARLSDLQAGLAPRECQIQFFWGERSLFVLGINNKEARSVQLPLSDSLRYALQRIKNQILTVGDRRESAYIRDSEWLFQQLLGRLRPIWENASHMTLIPDGPLNDLPFEALLTDFAEADCPYLICWLSVSYDYSATVHLRSRMRTQKGSWWGARTLLMAPSAFAITEKPGLVSLVDYTSGQQQIAHRLHGDFLVREEASKAFFLTRAGNYEILHLATHGQMDTTHLFSWLAFPTELLYAHEIYNLNLAQVRMAVLGACETGLGKREKSEGNMSLARAFSYAGCPSVLMTLWSASAATTFDELLPNFYAHLATGETKAEALRQAKLSMIRGANASQRHPYFWAALVSTGNQEAISLGPSWGKLTGVALGLCFLLYLGLRIYQRQGHQAPFIRL